MKFKLLKSLLILSLLTAMACCFTLDIFGTTSGKTLFFSAVGLVVLIPIILAIWKFKQYGHYLNLLIPIWSAVLCFSSDFLQQTLFIRQRTSTYLYQKERETFITKNEAYILSEAKRIEVLISNDILDENIETQFVDLRASSPSDTTVTEIIKGMPVKIRYINTNFKTRSFGFQQEQNYKLESFWVRQGKVIRMSIYNSGFKESPYFYNYSIYFYPYANIDQQYFMSEIKESGTHYYLKYCNSRNYIFESKWIFRVEGKCFG